jgi:hypothetical protein
LRLLAKPLIASISMGVLTLFLAQRNLFVAMGSSALFYAVVLLAIGGVKMSEIIRVKEAFRAI